MSDYWIKETQFHTVDPATFQASNSVLGTLFSSENSLRIQLCKRGFVSLPHLYCKY